MMIPRSPPGRGMRSAISATIGHALGEFQDDGREERGSRRQGLRIQRHLGCGSPPMTSQISGCFSAMTRHRLVPVPAPITERSSALRM